MHTVTILATELVTHNVKRYIIEKPERYVFTPGQATDVAINKSNWRDETRPFTFTILNEAKILEFTIKSYFDHDGVTKQLWSLKPGDELLIGDPWGTIQYRGPGVFIAGGAGITPFIAIFRDLYEKGQLHDNTLMFSNKTQADIILEKELGVMFEPQNLLLTLTQEEREGYFSERVDTAFIRNHINNFSQHFYVCGPKPMVKDIRASLESLGAAVENVVFER